MIKLIKMVINEDNDNEEEVISFSTQAIKANTI